MINMTIRELYYTFADFRLKLEFLFIILILQERNSEAAMGGGEIYFLGCSVAQLGSSVAQ
jgi:hypothetical protein